MVCLWYVYGGILVHHWFILLIVSHDEYLLYIILFQLFGVTSLVPAWIITNIKSHQLEKLLLVVVFFELQYTHAACFSNGDLI